MTFFVTAGGRSVVSLSIPRVNAFCTGGGGAADRILVSEAAIRPDGSFVAKTSQNGVLPNGTKATFAYSIPGHFQGVTTAGAAIAAGSYREDIAVTDSPTRTCTSNDQFWTATRR